MVWTVFWSSSSIQINRHFSTFTSVICSFVFHGFPPIKNCSIYKKWIISLQTQPKLFWYTQNNRHWISRVTRCVPKIGGTINLWLIILNRDRPIKTPFWKIDRTFHLLCFWNIDVRQKRCHHKFIFAVRMLNVMTGHLCIMLVEKKEMVRMDAILEQNR